MQIREGRRRSREIGKTDKKGIQKTEREQSPGEDEQASRKRREAGKHERDKGKEKIRTPSNASYNTQFEPCARMF